MSPSDNRELRQLRSQQSEEAKMVDWFPFRDYARVDRATGSMVRSATGEPSPSKGAFVTADTVVTYLGASTLVLVSWKLLAALKREWFGGRMNTVWISLIIGLAVIVLSWPVKDEMAVPVRSLAGAQAIIVGLFNSIILAAASIGVDATGFVGTPAAG